MATIDYEKRYKKALGWMQSPHNGLHGKTKEEAERYFPELAFCEDERIRNFLHHTFTVQYLAKDKLGKWHGEPVSNILSWLEKQGEKGTIGNEKKIPFSEQKSAWSEEDEINLERCITKIEIDIQNWEGHGKTMIDGDEDLIAWLKSLKDRVQPQPKQEWNEEDNAMLISIENILIGRGHSFHDKEINWLKSLRPQNRCTYNPYKTVVESIAEMCEKYEDANLDSLKDFYSNVKVKCKDAKEYDSLYPQSQWKPSEEQMEALDDAIDICSKQNNDIGDWLDNLREQLKKLKEA